MAFQLFEYFFGRFGMKKVGEILRMTKKSGLSGVWWRLAFCRNFLKIRIFHLFLQNVSNSHSEWLIVTAMVELLYLAGRHLLELIFLVKKWCRCDCLQFCWSWARLPSKTFFFRSFWLYLWPFHSGFTSWLMEAWMAFRKIIFSGMVITWEKYPHMVWLFCHPSMLSLHVFSSPSFCIHPSSMFWLSTSWTPPYWMAKIEIFVETPTFEFKHRQFHQNCVQAIVIETCRHIWRYENSCSPFPMCATISWTRKTLFWRRPTQP